MSNINLLAHEENKRSSFPFQSGVVMVASVLLLAVLVYLGMIFYQKKLDGQYQTVNKEYVSEHGILTKGSAGNILDFQSRLTNAEKLVKNNEPSVENFLQLEKTMIAGAYLKTYNYEAGGKSISLKGTAGNFSEVAKQILSFKGNSYFSSVQTDGADLNDSGGVDFSLNLKIN